MLHLAQKDNSRVIIRLSIFTLIDFARLTFRRTRLVTEQDFRSENVKSFFNETRLLSLKDLKAIGNLQMMSEYDSLIESVRKTIVKY
jgi:hypothetical protein